MGRAMNACNECGESFELHDWQGGCRDDATECSHVDAPTLDRPRESCGRPAFIDGLCARHWESHRRQHDEEE